MNLILNFLFSISCLHIIVTFIRFLIAFKSLNPLELNLYDKIGLYVSVGYFVAYIFS